MPLEKTFSVKACVQEGCASYFSGGHYGDITGEENQNLYSDNKTFIWNPSFNMGNKREWLFFYARKPYLINSNKAHPRQ